MGFKCKTMKSGETRGLLATDQEVGSSSLSGRANDFRYLAGINRISSNSFEVGISNFRAGFVAGVFMVSPGSVRKIVPARLMPHTGTGDRGITTTASTDSGPIATTLGA